VVYRVWRWWWWLLLCAAVAVAVAVQLREFLRVLDEVNPYTEPNRRWLSFGDGSKGSPASAHGSLLPPGGQLVVIPDDGSVGLHVSVSVRDNVQHLARHDQWSDTDRTTAGAVAEGMRDKGKDGGGGNNDGGASAGQGEDAGDLRFHVTPTALFCYPAAHPGVMGVRGHNTFRRLGWCTLEVALEPASPAAVEAQESGAVLAPADDRHFHVSFAQIGWLAPRRAKPQGKKARRRSRRKKRT